MDCSYPATFTGTFTGTLTVRLPDQPPVGGGGPPVYPQFPIAGYPDSPYPGQPIYRPGYPGGAPPPSFRPPSVPGGGPPVYPQFPIAGYPDSPYPGQPIYRPGYPGGAPPPSLTPIPPEPPAVDPTHARMVMYVPNTYTGQIERITFTVELPPPPSEATPKPAP
jgi:hypothetical protein